MDCATNRRLEERRRRGDARRASGYDTVRFAGGYLVAEERGNIGEDRRSRFRRIERSGPLEMNNFKQHELGFPGGHANRQLRRGIYLVPSVLTVANMLCGFYAVMATLK